MYFLVKRKKMLEIRRKVVYNNRVVTLRALMREVAERVFPRSDVRFKKTGDKVTALYFWVFCDRTGQSCDMKRPVKCAVATCRAELLKVRKGGDFFYG